MTTPTEGVKLEPVGWRWRFMNGEWNWFDGAFMPDGPLDADDEVQLLYGPQAAKRIEELEAEVARLKVSQRGGTQRKRAETAEAKLLKAERQRDEAVGALTVIANASERSETMFGGKMSEITRVFQNITRVSRSVLTSIREG